MSKKPKKFCRTLNYIEYLIILAYVITGCVSISVFSSLVCISIRTMGSVLGLKTCAITARIRKYKSIIKKKKKKHDKIVLWAKTELNGIEVPISRAFIDSYISPNEFVSVNNVLREYDYIIETIKT